MFGTQTTIGINCHGQNHKKSTISVMHKIAWVSEENKLHTITHTE